MRNWAAETSWGKKTGLNWDNILMVSRITIEKTIWIGSPLDFVLQSLTCTFNQPKDQLVVFSSFVGLALHVFADFLLDLPHHQPQLCFWSFPSLFLLPDSDVKFWYFVPNISLNPFAVVPPGFSLITKILLHFMQYFSKFAQQFFVALAHDLGSLGGRLNSIGHDFGLLLNNLFYFFLMLSGLKL